MSLDLENNTETDAQQPQQDRKSLLAEQLGELSTDDVSHETKPERTRDESGKFSAKAPESKGVVAKGGAGDAATSAPGEPVWKRPPASWKKDFHEVWNTADPRLQEYAYQREEQMRAGVEPLLPKAQLADAISQAAEPYMNTIRGLNLDLPKAIEGLMRADHELRTLPVAQKYQKAAQILAGYGIDIRQFSGQVQTGQQSPGMDPNFYALQHELNSVRGEISSWKQQQEAAQEAQTLAEINKFAPSVEHFEQARPTMIQLLQSGVADNLEDAYKKAIRLNDELFTAEQTRLQTEAAKNLSVTKNTQAQRAKAAAVSVKGTTPGASKPTKAQDRRSMLAEQFDGISERL